MSVARSRILDLVKTQCRIFRATFNPERLRLGNKVLRARLKGASMLSYYPRRIGTIQQLKAQYGKQFEIEDEREEERVEKVRFTRARGKGPPKKKKSQAESKRFSKRKPTGPPV